MQGMPVLLHSRAAKQQLPNFTTECLPVPTPFTDHKFIVLVQKKKNHSHLFCCPAVANGQPILKIKGSFHISDTAACIVVVLQNNSFILLKGPNFKWTMQYLWLSVVLWKSYLMFLCRSWVRGSNQHFFLSLLICFTIIYSSARGLIKQKCLFYFSN